MATQDFGRLTKGQVVLGRHHKVNSGTDTFKFSIGADSSGASILLDNLRAGRDADLKLYRDSDGNGKFDIRKDALLSPSTPVTGSSRPQELISASLFPGQTYFAQVSRNPLVSGEASYNLFAQAV